MSRLVLLWSCAAACRIEVRLGSAERCDGADNDGDDLVDEDLDGDGDGYVPCPGPAAPADCDDADPRIAPFAPEACDGRDTDCDGVIPAFEADEDQDGFRVCEGDCDDRGAGTQPADDDRDGWSACDGDCDDLDPSRAPDALEVCDGVDGDCDGTIPATERDADGDGWSTCGGDCDDADPLVSATDGDGDGAATCGALADCDDADPAVRDRTLWFADADGDGAGDPTASVYACAPPLRHVADASDCDDADPEVHTAAIEICDGKDDDCDLVVDEGFPMATWYADLDGDGAGDAGSPVVTCEALPGHVASAGDCDDLDPAVAPSAVEVCDDVDNDCDGRTDADAVDASTTWLDSDGDGSGDAGAPWTACAALPGHVAASDDCDDTDRFVYPGAAEVCGDGVDQDCDGGDSPCS